MEFRKVDASVFDEPFRTKEGKSLAKAHPKLEPAIRAVEDAAAYKYHPRKKA